MLNAKSTPVQASAGSKNFLRTTTTFRSNNTEDGGTDLFTLELTKATSSGNKFGYKGQVGVMGRSVAKPASSAH